MDESASLPTAAANVPAFNADAIFSALNEPTRRQMLIAMFDGQFRRAQALCGPYPKHSDLARKHLAVLVKARLLVAEPDPEDTRRHRYKLAPTVKTATTPEGRMMDFGPCILRCPA